MFQYKLYNTLWSIIVISFLKKPNFKIPILLTTGIALIILIFLAVGCSQTEELKISTLPETQNIGNKSTDLFFNKKQLQELGIKGKIVATLLINKTPQIVLFDIDAQRIKILTSSAGWNRAPEFLPNGEKIVFCTGRSGVSQLMIYDLKTDKETTLTGTDINRYDPEPVSSNKIIYNVFPPSHLFYLATQNLNTKKETTLTFTSKSFPGKNLAVRAAEPAFDNKENILYFVTDLAYEGKPKPLNIWKADLKSGQAEQITHNTTAKVWDINGSKLVSPQFYDLRHFEKKGLLFCVRFIEKHTPAEQPRFTKSEVHLTSPDGNKDEVLYSSNSLLRSPIALNNKYVLIADLNHRKMILVNIENEKDVKTFLSNVNIVGDIDYFKD